MRKPPFGTAQAEVLLKLTSPTRKEPIWYLKDSGVLYESRAMTHAICVGLLLHGFLDEKPDGNSFVYSVTDAGFEKADRLRGDI